MQKWEERVHRLSRDDGFLAKTCFSAIGLALVLALIVSYLPWRPAKDKEVSENDFSLLTWQDDQESSLAFFVALLDAKEIAFPRILYALMDLDEEDRSAAEEAISSSKLQKTGKDVAMALLAERFPEGSEVSKTGLEALAASEPPPRYANLALGLIYEEESDKWMQARAWEREGTFFPEAQKTREQVIWLYLDCGQTAEVQRLLKEKSFQDAFTPSNRMFLAARLHEWSDVLRWQIPASYSELNWQHVVPTVIVGLTWFLLSLQWAQSASFRKPFLYMAFGCVLLGVLSAQGTLFVVLWQEEMWNLKESADLAGNLLFYFGGVGLREEFLKLLFFVPFLPLIVRWDDELKALLLAGCVGLGFAVEENLGYYLNGDAGTSIGRFLTANFFHLSATGLCGLALFQAVTRRAIWDHFFFVFVVIVLVHGAYDALLSIPEFDDLSLFASAVYVYLCLHFFAQVNQLRSTQRRVVSMKACFLGGFVSLICFALIWSSWELGFRLGVYSVGTGLLSMIIITYMFLREFEAD